MSEIRAADYFRDQARVLLKQIGSDNAAVRAGALRRLRRVRPAFAGVPDEDVSRFVRLGDCLEVVAAEQGKGWREFVRELDGVDGGSDLHDVPNDRRLKHICFSLGNSSAGAVGATIWVYARSADEALQLARRALRDADEGIPAVEFPREDDAWVGVDYLKVYFNHNALSLADIEDWEYADEYSMDDGWEYDV